MIDSRFMVKTLVVVAVVVSVFASGARASIQGNDVPCMQALFDAWANGNLNWADNTDPCDPGWTGVTCTNGRVTHL